MPAEDTSTLREAVTKLSLEICTVYLPLLSDR